MDIPDFIIIPCLDQAQVDERRTESNCCCKKNFEFVASSIGSRWEEPLSSSYHDNSYRRHCHEPPQCPLRNKDDDDDDGHTTRKEGITKEALKRDSKPCCPRRCNSFKKEHNCTRSRTTTTCSVRRALAA